MVLGQDNGPVAHKDKAFRYFRIIATGKNSFTGKAGWQYVLVASAFEIYGTLIETENKKKPKIPSKIATKDDKDDDGEVTGMRVLGMSM